MPDDEKKPVEGCASCRFYSDPPADHVGRCRRFPPDPKNRWQAQVNPDDWCGEYRAKGGEA